MSINNFASLGFFDPRPIRESEPETLTASNKNTFIHTDTVAYFSASQNPNEEIVYCIDFSRQLPEGGSIVEPLWKIIGGEILQSYQDGSKAFAKVTLSTRKGRLSLSAKLTTGTVRSAPIELTLSAPHGFNHFVGGYY